jgi:hypothetical protein
VFHAHLLTPYQENETHGRNFIEPPPDLIDGQEEHEVEAIIGHRKRGLRYQYLVKWKGYSMSDNTWEPETNLTHTEELLEAYKGRHWL